MVAPGKWGLGLPTLQMRKLSYRSGGTSSLRQCKQGEEQNRILELWTFFVKKFILSHFFFIINFILSPLKVERGSLNVGC